MGLRLDTLVRYIKGIGPERAKLLNKLGVFTIQDLLEYYPRDWILPTDVIKINQMQAGKNAIIIGKIKSIDYNKHNRIPIFKIVVEDDTGLCDIIWYNSGWLRHQLKIGQMIMLSGKTQI